MEFKNREKEIEFLKSLKPPFRLSVVGRRRIGKTTLVDHFFKDNLPLFISAEKTEKELISGWVEENRNKLYLPSVSTLNEFFEYLFNKEKNRVIFIDEFQNVLKVNKSFLYDLQKLLDRHKDVSIVVSGSYISVMKKIIEDYKSPLYGRFDFTIKLREFNFNTAAQICRDFGYTNDDAVMFYSVFGGVPKYYEALEKLGFPPFMRFVERMFILYPRPLGEEIRTMLREEFGKEYKMFFSILSSIASGKNTLKEISEYTGKGQTGLTKYISLLKDDFEMISKEIPVTEKKSKKGGYMITSNVFLFWLYFIWKNYSLLERNEEDILLQKVASEINSFTGKRFEDIAKDMLRSGSVNLPFKPDRIGRQWGKMPGKKAGSDQYEIDIVGLNEKTGEIMFCECKWYSLDIRSAKKLLMELRTKAAAVMWKNENRREYFGIIARKINGKEALRKDGYIVFDLADLGSGITFQ
ncbi:MAG: ATP-binding protein [Euryarchaeota archaeon]|nr:ATP-binding protein [Euryarchaeota archaeon]MBU4221343.1 ATP-binding protein [Euryarchaeota archaeon]MBU4340414.1 ATP-binding protein [Euryarchaeota archaeon]MBU4454048.1 ATP-binding protein [Euryarchaeota archaeon]MCG2735289.1 ATP-binding protein [Candidatus Methanoperedenaceae archaeon]